MDELVKRIPIRIRKSIHKEYCRCWDVDIFTVNGEPQFLIGDKLSDDDMVRFIEEVGECVPIHFRQPIEECEFKVRYVLSKKIPVVIRTNKVLPEWVIPALSSVPHSGIQLSINFLEGSMRNRLEEEVLDADIREMLSLAKSWKIKNTLVLSYMPHLTSKLDVLEITDSFKNYVSHILLSFEDVLDEQYYEMRHVWEVLKTSSLDKFRQYYEADVPRRAWTIRQRHRDDIIYLLFDYLKGKKIGLEVVNDEAINGRIRHISSGLSDLPLGIKPFFYKKEEGNFVAVEKLEGSTCPTCGNSIFF